MAIYLSKPITYTSANFAGGVVTWDSSDLGHSDSDSPADVNSDIMADTGSRASIGWSTDQLSNSDWYNGSTSGFGMVTFKISAIGSNSSPTISALNQTELVTEILHGSHSNSINGQSWNTSGNGYTIDTSSMTITTADSTVISYTAISPSYTTTQSSMDNLRTQDTNNTWYYNGIQFGSQSGGSASGNEGLAWYQDESATNYFDNISESNFFNNATDVTNKRKNHRRAMTSLAESTSTDAIEKFTKLMNLKLLDRIIDADDYREAERFALSRLTDSEQTEIKNIIRYS